MDQVRWIEAPVEPELHVELAPYDHHRFDVAGTDAVLITYLRAANPGRGVLAVMHAAASRHPAVPDAVNERLGRLIWRPARPPETVDPTGTPSAP